MGSGWRPWGHGVGYLNWGSGQVEKIKAEGMQRQYTRQKIKLCKAPGSGLSR